MSHHSFTHCDGGGAPLRGVPRSSARGRGLDLENVSGVLAPGFEKVMTYSICQLDCTLNGPNPYLTSLRPPIDGDLVAGMPGFRPHLQVRPGSHPKFEVVPPEADRVDLLLNLTQSILSDPESGGLAISHPTLWTYGSG